MGGGEAPRRTGNKGGCSPPAMSRNVRLWPSEAEVAPRESNLDPRHFGHAEVAIEPKERKKESEKGRAAMMIQSLQSAMASVKCKRPLGTSTQVFPSRA